MRSALAVQRRRPLLDRGCRFGANSRRRRPRAAVRQSVQFYPKKSGFVAFLHIEAEKRDIAVGHAVVAPLGAHLALIFGALGAEGDEILQADDLGADETALKVFVDAPGGAAGVGAGANRPRPWSLWGRT